MMKPKLTSSLKAAILGTVLTASAQADYSGSKISNQADPSANTPAQSGDIYIDYGFDQSQNPSEPNIDIRGGVELVHEAGKGLTTTLEGNISITTGYGTKDAGDDMNYSGVLISPFTDITTPDPDLGAGYDSAIILKTLTAGDAITINNYGNIGAGVNAISSSAKIVLDASSSDKGIEINLLGTRESSWEYAAVRAARGTVEMAGDVKITSLRSGTFGINAYQGGTVTIDGSLDIDNPGEKTRGIRAQTDGASITVTGDLNVKSEAEAINAYSTGVILIHGKTNATAAAQTGDAVRATTGGSVTLQGDTVASAGRYGIYADNSSITLGGNADITITGTDSTVRRGIIASNSATITVAGETNINASTDSTIGVRSGQSSHVILNGEVAIQSDNSGFSVANEGRITANASVDIQSVSNHAVLASGSNSSVTLNGASRISTGSGYNSLWSLNGGSITANEAQYTIQGNIGTSGAGAQINLAFSGKSTLAGATSFNGAGQDSQVINLNLQGDSLWAVTGNSQLTHLTLGQGSALQLAFNGSSLTDIITATGTITLEAGSMIYLTGDLSALEGGTFDFFSGTVDNRGVQFVGFDGISWVEYEYTQTPGTNSFAFSTNAPTVIEEPGFIPEPTTATLGLLGLASLLTRRRRA